MKILMDPRAGFCSGVRRVIQLAEKELAQDAHLLALGELIHNRQELERLQREGLRFSDSRALETPAGNGAKLLIRAHGEPPETYRKAHQAGYTIVDGTCPIVIRSQKLAARYSNAGYQVVIVGKPGHAEVVGIAGHCRDACLVVSSPEEARRIPGNRKTFVLAQTTIPAKTYLQVLEVLRQREIPFETKNTICGFISGRDRQLQKFARECDVLIMVGGRHSSNTRALFEVCREHNQRAHWIETAAELRADWFRPEDRVGVTGGASTPRWLMEEVGRNIARFFNENGSATR